MIIYPDLFLTENTKKDYKKIVRHISKGNHKEDVFLVTLSTDSAGLFDIVEYKTLFFCVGDVDKTSDLVVIGIGSDYEDAKRLALDIVASYYASGITSGIKDYFYDRLTSDEKVSL